eukprot:scaffold2730_cov99-Isochrysis_galbana.AAC.3
MRCVMLPGGACTHCVETDIACVPTVSRYFLRARSAHRGGRGSQAGSTFNPRVKCRCPPPPKKKRWPPQAQKQMAGP